MEKFEKKISFVIPCYRSENTIEAVVEDICKEFPSEEYDKEIVLVNDGSRDGTYAKLRELADKNSEVVAINLSKNFGQDGATMCGLSQATGEYIIVLDDDGQNPPYEAHKLLEQIEKGYDAVTGKMLVCVNPQWFRPTDVDNLWGNPTKAKTVLGWNPQKTSYEELIRIMAEHDRKLAKREKAILAAK